jgi:hypothetical protein
VIAAALAAVLAAPGTAVAPTRIVDRTFGCETLVHAGLRGIAVRGGSNYAATPREYSLYLDSGALYDSEFLVGAGRTWGARVDIKRCREAPTAGVSLRAGNLVGGRETFYPKYQCELSGRILVRVRATLARPGRWLRRTPRYAGINGPVTSATIAVRSPALGKPIAFTSFDAKTGVRVFVEPDRCVKD